ncbi:hypothetical protein [uncultured Lacinutrix sp.]|uniref:hypothetical protein n=1 Tax=uncultured Lacinutrix sp. TaxID=574032 RepID=UPI00260A6F2D|nr:hypothetical protein [uncultured Lacinutrix sp.]
MKYFLLLIVSIFAFKSLNVKEVRTAYRAAGEDNTKVEAFYKLVSTVKKTDKAVFVAYKGASIAMLAKGKKTIKEKKTGFIKGVELLEFAIKKEPNNIEARFIRLSIQENTPKLLKYKGKIAEDKHFILSQFKQIRDNHLKSHIKDYIMKSKGFTEEEKKKLQ